MREAIVSDVTPTFVMAHGLA